MTSKLRDGIAINILARMREEPDNQALKDKFINIMNDHIINEPDDDG